MSSQSRPLPPGLAQRRESTVVPVQPELPIVRPESAPEEAEAGASVSAEEEQPAVDQEAQKKRKKKKKADKHHKKHKSKKDKKKKDKKRKKPKSTESGRKRDSSPARAKQFGVWSMRQKAFITAPASKNAHGEVVCKMLKNYFPRMEGINSIDVNEGDVLEWREYSNPEGGRYERMDLSAYNVITDPDWLVDEEKLAKTIDPSHAMLGEEDDDFHPAQTSLAGLVPALKRPSALLKDKRRRFTVGLCLYYAKTKPGKAYINITEIRGRPKKQFNAAKEQARQRAIAKELASLHES